MSYFRKFSTDVINESISSMLKKYLQEIYDIYGEETFTRADWKKKTKLEIKANDVLKKLAEKDFLVKSGTRQKTIFQISKKGLDELGVDLKQNTASKNVKHDIDDLTKKKARRYKVPKLGRGDVFDDFFREVLQNMNSMIKKKNPELLLLVGKPGTGKTSTITQLATLFGMHLVTIEGAHVTEEDLINIPYVITKGFDSKGYTDTFKKDENADYQIVNAESSLVSKLVKLKFITDSEHQRMLEKSKILKKYYNKYKKYIDSVRQTPTHKSGFKCILFVDEFFRTSDKKIQNLLRTILNGRIGNTPIPDDAYLIFASNMNTNDDSLDDIALNQQFTSVTFDEPTVSGFANYIADKYTAYDDETGEETSDKKLDITIQPEVYNGFIENMNDEDINIEDKDVRISPRRMEQIMLYINSNVPVKDKKDVGVIMKVLKSNFTNFETGEVSKLYDKYKLIVQDIIIKTSPGINADVQPIDDTKWMHTLDNLIETKLEVGSEDKYPIMLQGLPGTAKTSTFKSIANKKHMGLITIDASTLTLESVNGVPLPKTDKKGIETVFSEPPLYQLIMSQYNAMKDEYTEEGRKYNFILFIDEFSRVESVAIQNKIRMLLLEGKVNSNYPLPEDVMITGAMNPPDSSNSTVELADHVKDVLNVVNVELSIDDLREYLATAYTEYQDEREELKFNVQKLCNDVVFSIVERFKSETDINERRLANGTREYWWSIGNYLKIYVSPREITDMILGSIERIYSNFQLDGWMDIKDFDDDVFDEFIDSAKFYVYKKMKGSLDFICDKQQIENVDKNKFLKVIREIIDSSDSFNLIRKVDSQAVNMKSFSSLFKSVNYDIKEFLDNDGELMVEDYLNSLDDYTQAAVDIGVLFRDIEQIGFNKTFTFILQFIDLIQKINWDKIQGGTFDQVKVSMVQYVLNLLSNPLFIQEYLSRSETEVNTFKEKIKKLKTL